MEVGPWGVLQIFFHPELDLSIWKWSAMTPRIRISIAISLLAAFQLTPIFAVTKRYVSIEILLPGRIALTFLKSCQIAFPALHQYYSKNTGKQHLRLHFQYYISTTIIIQKNTCIFSCIFFQMENTSCILQKKNT